jgi:hypothetical protein
MKLPEFKLVEEEADFWDSFDSAQILDAEASVSVERKAGGP